MSEKLEITNERLIKADRTQVFNAVADPKTLERWWGPHGFTNRIDAFDFREGGDWLITMTSSDGTDFANHWTFQAIEPEHRLLALHHEPMHVFTLEMTFVSVVEGTNLRWCMQFDPTEENRELQKFIHAANEQNLDRLEQVLQQGDQ